jgi:hypothetical protein
MKYFKTRARCSGCRLSFDFALTEEDRENGDFEVICPRCGEIAEAGRLIPCSADEYDEIMTEYEDFEEQYALEDLSEEDFEEDWE